MEHSLFESILSKDIFIPAFQEAIDSGKIKAHESTGKLYVAGDSQSNKGPWIYHKSHEDNLCGFWSYILFNFFHSKMGMPAAGCQSCWKIVVRPRTLEELMKLRKVQIDMDVSGKCGIERRYSVHGTYGGYFYTRSLEAGLKRYKEVRRQVDIHISSAVDVFLKRGCTEMEQAFGDSDKWEVTPQSAHWEKLVTDAFEYVPFKPAQPDNFKDGVMRKWIEYAYANGDPTYKLYTNGKPLYKPYVTYHDKKENK